MIEHFIKKFNKKLNRAIVGISAEAQDRFMDYDWPGNIRELEHALEHAFIVCRQNNISIDDLPSHLSAPPAIDTSVVSDCNGGNYLTIFEALDKTGWNKAKAARLLGISRQTLYRKMEELKINEEKT